MRQGQPNNNKRMRGRNNNRKGPNPLTRSFESNGPDVKIRGTALHVAEKYLQLARDAQSSGDRVAGENYLQHAEHYFRIVAAAQAQLPLPQQTFRSDDDEGDDEDDRANGYGDGERLPHQQQAAQPGYGLSDPQPYLNGGNGQGPQGGPQGHQPGPDGGQQGDEPRFDGQGGQHRDHRDNRDHGGFRGRRRRPFRGDRFGSGNDQREQGGGDSNLGGNQPSQGAGPTED